MRASILLLTVVTLAVLGLLIPVRPVHAEGSQSNATLLGQLGDEAERTRTRALRTLERADDLDEKDVAAALDIASPRARPLLLRLAAVRGMAGLVPRIVKDTSDPSQTVSEAAVRAIVTLGAEAVAAGEAHLTERPERAGALRRLRALDAQRTVEKAVLAKWRRKGGSYLGRYDDIAGIGWPLQPVLLAMLLDVPMEERFVEVPAKSRGAIAVYRARRAALLSIVRSKRRGYRTFEPLPVTIEPDDLFDLAAQALTDVGDMSLLGDLLETVAIELKQVLDRAGWRGRGEDFAAQEIEFILAARGRPRLLDRRIAELEANLAPRRHLFDRTDLDPDTAVFLANRLSDLARANHGGQRFKRAAECYEQLIAFTTRTAGEASPISVYNLACALARDGREKVALEQLDKALTLGTDDLSREWVSEDGDLHALHDDARFQEILDKHYGKP